MGRAASIINLNISFLVSHIFSVSDKSRLQWKLFSTNRHFVKDDKSKLFNFHINIGLMVAMTWVDINAVGSKCPTSQRARSDIYPTEYLTSVAVDKNLVIANSDLYLELVVINFIILIWYLDTSVVLYCILQYNISMINLPHFIYLTWLHYIYYIYCAVSLQITVRVVMSKIYINIIEYDIDNALNSYTEAALIRPLDISATT